MSKCKETAGVLYAHACPREASGQCSQCAKPICQVHQRQNTARQTLCIGCYKQAESGRASALDDPFLMSGVYFDDYDTGAPLAPGLRRSLSPSDEPGDELFEQDFDGT